jgi:hypothetical protein
MVATRRFARYRRADQKSIPTGHHNEAGEQEEYRDKQALGSATRPPLPNEKP